MKIRNRHLLRVAGWVATRAAKALVRSLLTEYLPLGTPGDPRDRRGSDRGLYCMWHETLLFSATHFGNPQCAVFISQHADGKLLGSLIESLGMGMVCGSSTRGGIEAVRKLTRGTDARRHLAVTPDGPRGPRRVVQPGAIYIASRTGMKIIPVGVGHHRPWRTASWDTFAIPKPFSRTKCISGMPIAVPDKLKPAGLDEYRVRVQAEMDRLTAMAEEWAMTGRMPGFVKPLKRAA